MCLKLCQHTFVKKTTAFRDMFLSSANVDADDTFNLTSVTISLKTRLRWTFSHNTGKNCSSGALDDFFVEIFSLFSFSVKLYYILLWWYWAFITVAVLLTFHCPTENFCFCNFIHSVALIYILSEACEYKQTNVVL